MGSHDNQMTKEPLQKLTDAPQGENIFQTSNLFCLSVNISVRLNKVALAL